MCCGWSGSMGGSLVRQSISLTRIYLSSSWARGYLYHAPGCHLRHIIFIDAATGPYRLTHAPLLVPFPLLFRVLS